MLGLKTKLERQVAAEIQNFLLDELHISYATVSSKTEEKVSIGISGEGLTAGEIRLYSILKNNIFFSDSKFEWEFWLDLYRGGVFDDDLAREVCQINSFESYVNFLKALILLKEYKFLEAGMQNAKARLKVLLLDCDDEYLKSYFVKKILIDISARSSMSESYHLGGKFYKVPSYSSAADGSVSHYDFSLVLNENTLDKILSFPLKVVGQLYFDMVDAYSALRREKRAEAADCVINGLRECLRARVDFLYDYANLQLLKESSSGDLTAQQKIDEQIKSLLENHKLLYSIYFTIDASIKHFDISVELDKFRKYDEIIRLDTVVPELVKAAAATGARRTGGHSGYAGASAFSSPATGARRTGGHSGYAGAADLEEKDAVRAERRIGPVVGPVVEVRRLEDIYISLGLHGYEAQMKKDLQTNGLEEDLLFKLGDSVISIIASLNYDLAKSFLIDQLKQLKSEASAVTRISSSSSAAGASFFSSSSAASSSSASSSGRSSAAHSIFELDVPLSR